MHIQKGLIFNYICEALKILKLKYVFIFFFVAGHIEIKPTREQSDEESKSYWSLNYNCFLPLMWLHWVCCIRKHSPWWLPYRLWVLRTFLARHFRQCLHCCPFSRCLSGNCSINNFHSLKENVSLINKHENVAHI